VRAKGLIAVAVPRIALIATAAVSMLLQSAERQERATARTPQRGRPVTQSYRVIREQSSRPRARAGLDGSYGWAARTPAAMARATTSAATASTASAGAGTAPVARQNSVSPS
jgi:hypothetical protein